ncbi:MAG: dTDP-4-dehydrorhamnose 3,5-epimerase, partial [Rectinema sp.]
VRVTQGKAWDVAVDLRAESSTFGKWHAVELSAENKLLFWIPEGFAHGFVALEDGTELQYKCTSEYAPESDSGIIWNDPELAVEWPIKDVILSEKDMKLQSFGAYKRTIQ